jgi:hypothetical protein
VFNNAILQDVSEKNRVSFPTQRYDSCKVVMKRQRKSSSPARDDDVADYDASVSGSIRSSRGTRTRNRTIKPQQGIERSMAPLSNFSMPAFSNLGSLSSIGSEFASAQATGLMHADFSFQPYASFPGSAEGSLSASTANVADLPGGEFSPMYSGNIAAACEAANQEVVQKHNDHPKDDDEEIQRKKAASRIVAWQSRERKRIEMEVLQERSAELTRRNAKLKSENDRLKLLIAHLKAVASNPVALMPFIQAEPFLGTTSSWTGSGRTGRTTALKSRVTTDPPSRSETSRESTQPSLQTYPPLFPGGQPLFGYPSAPGTVTMSPFFDTSRFLQQTQRQGEPPLPQQNQQIGLSLADHPALQQRIQTQQRPGSQDTAVPIEAASRPLLGLHEVAPLARLQGTLQGQQAPGFEIRRYSILPHARQLEDMHGAPPFDITSLLLPPGNLHVDVPLIRAIPKRRDTHDIEDDYQEKKKDTE